MVHIPDNAKPMTPEQFEKWWANLTPEKQQEWLEYSKQNLVKK